MDRRSGSDSPAARPRHCPGPKVSPPRRSGPAGCAPPAAAPRANASPRLRPVQHQVQHRLLYLRTVASHGGKIVRQVRIHGHVRQFQLVRSQRQSGLHDAIQICLGPLRRGPPQRAEADLNRIVKTTLSLTSHKLKLANVTVNADLADNLPAVRCDSSQIQQVVLNLVLNGAEATHSREERRLAVRTRRAQNGAAGTLSVQDNGEGVRPENLSRIFDPFFTTKPEGKGVGLGLAVSYGIVEAHGGDIAVTSKPGEGATFTVTLPVSGNAEEPAMAAVGAERA